MTVGLPGNRSRTGLGEVSATLALLLSRRWWWKTFIVLLAMGVMVALGFWQLDRLEQRRALNQQRLAALAAVPIELTGANLPLPPLELRDRQAVASGEFDYGRQVSVRNQILDGQPGHHLITPLLIAGSNKAVLVNRGWIPVDEADPGKWRTLDEQSIGPQSGILKPTVLRPDGAISAIPQDAVTGWYRLDIDAIAQALPYDLMPVVLQLLPENSRDPSSLPRRIQSDVILSQGNHLSYALQWFGFAITAAVVFVAVARRQS